MAETRTQLLLCIILLYAIGLTAQAPGYLGKRFSGEFSVHSNIQLSQPIKNSKADLNNSKFRLSRNFNFQLNYSLQRMSSISVGYTQFRVGLMTKYSIENLNNLIRIRNHHAINVKSFDLKYHKYKSYKGSLAPLGSSFYIGLNGMLVKGEIIIRQEDQSNVDLNNRTFDGLQQDHNLFGIGLGWNNRIMFFDNLYVKLGFGIAINIPPVTSFDGFNSFLIINPINNPDGVEILFEIESNRRILLNNFMLFEFGVGAVLF